MLFNGPMGGKEIYRKRREKLMEKIQDGIAIIASHPEQIRNDDVHHEYRQDSCFYYLTGYEEPEAVIVFNPTGKNKFIMFVREKDATRELWDGFRYGVEGTQEYFGVDQVYPISEFDKIMPEMIKTSDKIYYRMGEFSDMDEKVFSFIKKVKKIKGRSGVPLQTLADVKSIIGGLRLFKSKEELELMRKAGEISARGHLVAMRGTRPGMFEYEIQSLVESEFKRLGAPRLAYGSIVARGNNATVLHYVTNRDKTLDGDLVLIDAGAEYGYMAGDITRTYPVNGKFSKAQKKFYEGILQVQKACIKKIKPGIKFSEVHEFAIEGLTDVMLELGLLKGNAKQIIAKKEFFKYFPHGTSHWLGMDVHDAGLYQINGESRKLEAGMCFTVEPGLYVPLKDKTAPKEYRGMGVRIEDDIHVTPKGVEVFTTTAVKEVDEIEAIVGAEAASTGPMGSTKKYKKSSTAELSSDN